MVQASTVGYSIAIQPHPEITAIAWGTLRLVLQVRTNINQKNEILYLAISTLYERNNTLLSLSKKFWLNLTIFFKFS